MGGERIYYVLMGNLYTIIIYQYSIYYKALWTNNLVVVIAYYTVYAEEVAMKCPVSMCYSSNLNACRRHWLAAKLSWHENITNDIVSAPILNLFLIAHIVLDIWIVYSMWATTSWYNKYHGFVSLPILSSNVK